MKTEAIKANKAAREAADVVHHLILDEAMNHRGQTAVTYYKHILDGLRNIVPDELWPSVDVVRDLPMADEEARRFKKQVMDFGIHYGKCIEDVPLDYLVWLEEQPDFRRQLNRYLRWLGHRSNHTSGPNIDNPRLQREQETEP